ncbi:hypothetical protein HYV91_03095 [Candidatus Wolfebacteria bacterium]|nr:hypothetical protein [Candidatus Wolfebacteria bacterium]
MLKSFRVFFLIFFSFLILLGGARSVRAATVNELLAKIAELQDKIQILQKQLAELPPQAPLAPLAPLAPSSPVLSPGLKLGDQTILSPFAPFGGTTLSSPFSASPFVLAKKIGVELNPFAPPLTVLRGSTADLSYFLLSAPRDEAVNITNFTLKTNDAGRHLRNLKIIAGGLRFTSSRTSLASNDIISLSSSDSFYIPAGESYGIQVSGDILASAPTGTISGLITLVSCSGQGTRTFSSLACLPANLVGPNVTIINNPSLLSFSTSLPISLIYPNGGEQLQIGMNHKIRWDYATQAPFLPTDRLAKNIRIELWRAGLSLVTSRYYGAPLPADFDFLIPNYAMPGSDYKIRVVDADRPENYGESANDFILVR